MNSEKQRQKEQKTVPNVAVIDHAALTQSIDVDLEGGSCRGVFQRKQDLSKFFTIGIGSLVHAYTADALEEQAAHQVDALFNEQPEEGEISEEEKNEEQTPSSSKAPQRSYEIVQEQSLPQLYSSISDSVKRRRRSPQLPPLRSNDKEPSELDYRPSMDSESEEVQSEDDEVANVERPKKSVKTSKSTENKSLSRVRDDGNDAAFVRRLK